LLGLGPGDSDGQAKVIVIERGKLKAAKLTSSRAAFRKETRPALSVIGFQARLGERRREQVGPRDAPQDFAARPGRNAGRKQRSGRAAG
jgi:hypothetical protein